ncbi:MAG TPA: aspartate aminotransferase family protein [Firmicutes bacterium]|nr:aspartate aminotransferase family protein [Bacillota bacterium]
MHLGSSEIAELIKADQDYYLHPTSSIVALQEKGAKIIYRGKGSRVFDVAGKEYIDATAGLWYCAIGHGRDEIAGVMKQQAIDLSAYHSFNEFANVPAIRLARKVASMVPVPGAKIFFTSSGSEANDTIIRAVRFYWHARGMDSKDIIITRDKAYHGVSCGAVMATRLPGFHEGFSPLLPGFESIPPPYCYYCSWGKEYPQCNLKCALALEETIGSLGAENVAAFIAEPIMGTGGVIVPPPGYYQKIREICNRNQVLFIADEVINGFGRTGETMFGIEHWAGAVPDIMTLAKGITSGYVPLGAAVFSDEIFQVLKSRDRFFHGYTYSGHPLACQVGLKNIEIIERENLQDRAAVMGQRLQEGLRCLNLKTIGEVRGMGLMVGVDLVKDSKTREKFPAPLAPRVVEIAFEEGLIIRPLAGDILQLSPPLVITEEEIDRIVETLCLAIVKATEERG